MVATTAFTQPFFVLFAETFGVSERSDGYFLDTGQSGLLGTITTLSAAVASAARTADEATIAAHCGHIHFLLEFFAAYERGEAPAPDWARSWTTRVVDEAHWKALQHALQTSYTSLMARLQARESWPDEALGAAMLLLAHCAYHVGEIRQRLLWVNAEVHD
ncbi:MAG: hypothetical protein IPO81_25435 [Kouleothrix sp.]|nr:hypothetical protein [Kouleothrix sp.]